MDKIAAEKVLGKLFRNSKREKKHYRMLEERAKDAAAGKVRLKRTSPGGMHLQSPPAKVCACLSRDGWAPGGVCNSHGVVVGLALKGVRKQHYVPSVALQEG
jgi:hypothetical protein